VGADCAVAAGPRRLGRPRERDLRTIVDAILYLLWTGWLAAIAEPLLNVRRVMRQQLAVLHKMLLDAVRGDPVCRRLMTAPGVGAVVALTYRATVDQPQRFVRCARSSTRRSAEPARPCKTARSCAW